MLLLSACGGGTVASSKALSNGNKAAEIAKGYISMDITAKDACDALAEICDNMSYTADYSFEDRSADEQKDADAAISFDITMLRSAISSDWGTSGDAESFEKVEEQLHDLEETIKKYD